MVVNSKFKIPDIRELLQSLKNVRSEWRSKTPMQKWCYFYGIGKACYRFMLMPLMNDVSHVHWFGYFLLTYMTTSTALSLYTVLYYAYHGQLQMGLPSTCVAFIFVGHFPTAVALTSEKRFKLQALIDFGGRHIYHDSEENTEYNRICSNQMDRTMDNYISKMKVIAVAYSVATVAPIFAYFTSGKISTVTEMRIPFTERNSMNELIVNMSIQSIIAVHGAPSYTGLECFLSIFENVVTIVPRLIKSELVQTIQLYERKSISELELRKRIGNIVIQSNDTDNYVDSLSKIFYWRNLFTTSAFTYMIGMSIFCQFWMGFPSGYSMAFMSWTQLYFVCELGEKIQDNGFAEMLYQTKWEILPIDLQKTIMLLIHRKQNEEGLSMGPFGMGINRETFKLSTNKIYTFVMFLKNFFH